MSSWHGGLCNSWNNSGNLLAKQELHCSTEAEKATRGSEREPRTAAHSMDSELELEKVKKRHSYKVEIPPTQTKPRYSLASRQWMSLKWRAIQSLWQRCEGRSGRKVSTVTSTPTCTEDLKEFLIFLNRSAELLSRWEVCFGGFVDVCSIHLLNAVEACIIFSTQPNFIIDVYFLLSNITKIWME